MTNKHANTRRIHRVNSDGGQSSGHPLLRRDLYSGGGQSGGHRQPRRACGSGGGQSSLPRTARVRLRYHTLLVPVGDGHLSQDVI